MITKIHCFRSCANYQSISFGAHSSKVVPTRVIINADDLGLSQSIDSAIFRLAEKGAITSASLIAVGRDFDPAASWASKQKIISIGVHLCLTDGLMPLTDARGLVGDNHLFDPLTKLSMRAYCRSIPLDTIRSEWKAQISLIRSKGIEPTHLDSHQHVHILPGISDIIRELAQEESLAVRQTSGPFSFAFKSCRSCPEYWMTLCRPGVWKSTLVRYLGRRLKREFLVSGVSTTDSYVSPSSLCGRMRREVTQESVAMIAGMASMTGGTVEWVVHPSDIDEHDSGLGWMSCMRSSENRHLDSLAHMNALHNDNASVVTYSGVMRGSVDDS